VPLGHHTCVDCKKLSPETELTYSLLGLAGWREVRAEQVGKMVSIWRCSTCWAEFKKKTRARTQMNLPTLDPKRRKP
jgi:hypothetical protein